MSIQWKDVSAESSLYSEAKKAQTRCARLKRERNLEPLYYEKLITKQYNHMIFLLRVKIWSIGRFLAWKDGDCHNKPDFLSCKDARVRETYKFLGHETKASVVNLNL